MAVRVPATVALLCLGAVLLAVFLSRPPAQNRAIVPCPVYHWTGVHCPGCGSARATYALLHADIVGAWRKNPLLVTVLPFLVFAVLRSWWQWVRGGPFRDALVERWSLRLALPVLLIVIVFTVLRNLPGTERWLAPH